MELTPGLSTLSVLLIGFALGLRHAIDADHLAAVSTIVSEKKSLLTASWVGGLWGIGHTLSLFVVGVIVILLRVQISETAEARLEAAVGIMLIGLGLNALRKLFSNGTVHVHTHQHGEREHVHIHRHDEQKRDPSHHRYSVRSVMVGMIHGLAGSAALMLLILPAIDSPVAALVYILAFGIGSTGGMVAMSFIVGLPFHLTADRFTFMNKGISLAAAVFSLFLGTYIVFTTLVRV